MRPRSNWTTDRCPRIWHRFCESLLENRQNCVGLSVIDDQDQNITPDLGKAGGDGTQTLHMSREQLKVLSVKCSEAQQLLYDLQEQAPEQNLLKVASLRQKLGVRGGEFRYENSNLIGEGANAFVYSLEDGDCNREVAIKLLKDNEYAQKTEEIRRFVLEAGIVASLEHPSIIPVYDLNCDETGQVYLSMRRVRGHTLKEYIKNRENTVDTGDIQSVDDLVRVFLKVCDAIAYAHSHGHVHQDIKPENIMIGEFGEVFVIDWGASASSGTDEMSVTPVYMSPAQANAEPATVQDDVFCLAATMFHCMLLRFPTTATSLEEMWEKRRRGIIDPISDEDRAGVPAPLLAIVMKGLEPCPLDRYRTIQELADDLKRYQSGVAVGAYNYSFREFLTRWYKQHKAAVNTAIVAGCCLLLVGGWLLNRSRRERQARLDAQKEQMAEREAKLNEREKRMAAERERMRLEQQRQEGWISVVDLDFSKGDTLDPRFGKYYRDTWSWPVDRKRRTEKYIAVQDGFLKLLRCGGRSILRWDESISEETKVEIVVLNREHTNFSIAVSGDTMDGYRLRFEQLPWNNKIELETCSRGYFEVIHTVEEGLDPAVPEYYVTFLRSGNRFRASINDQEVMDFYDPMAPRGEQHQSFAVARFDDQERDTLIKSLRVWRRRAPEYVDILEVGRAMLHNGRFEDARSWFDSVIADHQNPEIREEGRFLRALSYPKGSAGRDQALETVANTAESRYSTQASRMLTFERALAGDVRGAVDALDSVSIPRLQQKTWNNLRWRIIAAFRKSTPAEQELFLQGMAKLNIEEVILTVAGLKSLKGLDGARFQGLDVSHNKITDLEPLRDSTITSLNVAFNPLSSLKGLEQLPLEELTITHTEVQDLSPVKACPIRELHASDSQIADLSPLQGKKIEELSFNNTPVRDLKPLVGMPLMSLGCNEIEARNFDMLSSLSKLKTLSLNENEIETLEMLRLLKLKALDIRKNQVTDLSPLSGMPLSEVDVGKNRIRDLTPIVNPELRNIACDDNEIADISCLRGSKVRVLSLGGNPILDYSVLKEIRVKDLYLSGTTLTSEQAELIASLPLVRLGIDLLQPEAVGIVNATSAQQVNSYKTDYLRQALPRILAAYRAWKAGKPYNASLSLRQFARPVQSVHVMAFPLEMSWEDASQFSRWQGGTLFCPETDEKRNAMNQALGPVSRLLPSYWIGLEVRDGKLHWQHGRPFEFEDWRQREDKRAEILAGEGRPSFSNKGTFAYSGWNSSGLDLTFLIEWAK